MKKHSFRQLHSFLLLWGSQTVSQLGTAMTDYAVIIWVYSRKGTASSVTLLIVCTFLPTIFFSGFPDRRFTEEIAMRLKKELTDRKRIVFVTAYPALKTGLRVS